MEIEYVEFMALGKGAIPRVGRPHLGTLLAGPALALQSSCQLTGKATVPDGSTLEITEDCEEPPS